MPSKASLVAAADTGRNPEMESSLWSSSLGVRKDMNAGAAPDVAGNCHCVAGGLSGAHAIDRSQSEILQVESDAHALQQTATCAAGDVTCRSGREFNFTIRARVNLLFFVFSETKISL